MTQDITNCPLCGSTRTSLFDHRMFRDIAVTNRICDTCGLVFESPRMSESEIDEFYKSEYRRLNQGGSEEPVEKEIAIQRARADALFTLFSAKVRKVTRHLDIGCSAGLLLAKFQEYYHCDAIGIEPGNAFREYAIRQKLTVYSSLDELRQGGEEKFDLISMSHVLEHMADPVAYLMQLRESFLTQSGWLYLEVPNLYAHESFEIAHLYSFSSHTVTQVLQKAGYQIVRMVKHGQPRSKFTPLYINVLARPDLSVPHSFSVSPEHGVRNKRRRGVYIRDRMNSLLRLIGIPKRIVARLKRMFFK